jgi:hypothetical protein
MKWRVASLSPLGSVLHVPLPDMPQVLGKVAPGALVAPLTTPRDAFYQHTHSGSGMRLQHGLISHSTSTYEQSSTSLFDVSNLSSSTTGHDASTLEYGCVKVLLAQGSLAAGACAADQHAIDGMITLQQLSPLLLPLLPRVLIRLVRCTCAVTTQQQSIRKR